MRKTIGMIGIMAAALAMGATTSKVAASQVNEANRQMIPGGGGMSYITNRRERLPFTGGDNSPARRRKLKLCEPVEFINTLIKNVTAECCAANMGGLQNDKS